MRPGLQCLEPRRFPPNRRSQTTRWDRGSLSLDSACFDAILWQIPQIRIMRHNRANWPTEGPGRRVRRFLAIACLGALILAAVGVAGIAIDSTLTAQDRGTAYQPPPAPAYQMPPAAPRPGAVNPAMYPSTQGYPGQQPVAPAGYYAQQPQAGGPAAAYRGPQQNLSPGNGNPAAGVPSPVMPWAGQAPAQGAAPAGHPPARMAALPANPAGTNPNQNVPATGNAAPAGAVTTPPTATPPAQAATPAPKTVNPSTAPPINVAGLNGNQVLAMAVERLQGYTGIGARVRHRVEMFNQQLMGAGHYWQGPTGSLQSRLELQLQTDKKTCSWLQVCDGKTLWTYQQFVESRQLTQVDVEKVLAATADQKPGPSAPMSLGIGGLPELLRRLNQSFTFSAPEPGTLGQWPVLRLVGEWKPEMLMLLLPKQAKAIEVGEAPKMRDLAQHVPYSVTLYLGQSDLFPYRIEYNRPDTPSGQPMLAMEFFEVRFDLPVDPERFTYRPSYRKIEDRTAQYIQQLR